MSWIRSSSLVKRARIELAEVTPVSGTLVLVLAGALAVEVDEALEGAFVVIALEGASVLMELEADDTLEGASVLMALEADDTLEGASVDVASSTE